MNAKHLLPILLAMALSGDSPGMSRQYREEVPIPSEEEREKQRIQRLKAKGLKEFFINGESIWATSERAAIKKYNSKSKKQS